MAGLLATAEMIDKELEVTTKLSVGDVGPYRAILLKRQGGLCALCGEPIKERDVLDHDHKQGHIRGVLHSGCNSLLGKLENNHKRYGVANLFRFLSGAGAYLTRGDRIPLDERVLHPSFKTPEEIREAHNAKARARRAAAKEAKE